MYDYIWYILHDDIYAHKNHIIYNPFETGFFHSALTQVVTHLSSSPTYCWVVSLLYVLHCRLFILLWVDIWVVYRFCCYNKWSCCGRRTDTMTPNDSQPCIMPRPLAWEQLGNMTRYSICDWVVLCGMVLSKKRRLFLVHISVYSGCLNRIPPTGWLTRNFFFHGSGRWKSKVSVPQGWFLLRCLLLADDGLLTVCSQGLFLRAHTLLAFLPLFIRTSINPFGLALHPYESFNLNYLLKGPVFKYSDIGG